MMTIVEFVHELRNKEQFAFVEMGKLGVWAADTCSIQAVNMDGAADFDSGVVTLLRANDKALGGAALGGGVTISAPGITNLTGSEWQKNAYLQMAVTTQSTNSRVIRFIVCLKRFGFSV